MAFDMASERQPKGLACLEHAITIPFQDCKIQYCPRSRQCGEGLIDEQARESFLRRGRIEGLVDRGRVK